MRHALRVWRTPAVLTLIACAIVAPTIMVLYPREDWAWELSLSLSLTVTLTFCLTTYMAVQNRKITALKDALERMVNRDRLTGLSTRDHFFGIVEDDGPDRGVVMMIDIDHFKRINDTYGHLCGDLVIAEVANSLTTTCRAGDLICRFGGEEFLTLLPRASRENAAEVARRILYHVRRHSVVWRSEYLRVTVSIGAAEFHRQEEIEAAISEADRALYAAKRKGRDTAVLAWAYDYEGAAEDVA